MPDHAALAREAREHMAAAADCLGWTDPGGPASERTTAPADDRLTEAARRSPRALWLVREAQSIWWAMALSIRNVARAEARRREHSGPLPLDGLYAEALLGLYEGCRRWDPARGVRLEHYAGQWCRARLNREMNDARLIRLSHHAHALRVQVSQYQRAGISRPADLADRAGASVEDVERALALDPVSLDAPVEGADGRPGASMAELLGEEATQLEDIERARDIELVREVIESIGPRLSGILYRRLHGETLAEIADDLGISAERVRVLAHNARRRVRDRLVQAFTEEPIRRTADPEAIRRALAAGASSAVEVARATGITESAAYNAMWRAERAGKLEKVAPGRFALAEAS